MSFSLVYEKYSISADIKNYFGVGTMGYRTSLIGEKEKHPVSCC